jgi:CIC family chloride channel protein
MQLKRRGVDLKSGLEGEILRGIRVADVMSAESARIGPDADLQVLRKALQAAPTGQLFVVRGSGELYGTVTLADLSDSAFDHGFDLLVKAADVARRHPPVLMPEDDLDRALNLMRDAGEEHVAVVRDPRSMVFLGCVRERDVMAAYNRALLSARGDESA